MAVPWQQQLRLDKVFAGRRGRHLRENLTAYLLVAPALILIFIFGIFPVGFALYVSLHRWIILRSDFRGMDNYVAGVDSLAYLAGFALGVGAIIAAGLLLRRVVQTSALEEKRPWPEALAGLLYAAVVLTFVRWFYYFLPEFLDIATKMRGLERTRQLFFQLLGEAFRAEPPWAAWRWFLIAAVLSLAVMGLLQFLRRPRKARSHQPRLALMWLSLATGIGLLYFSYQQVAAAYAVAFAEDTDPGIWPQLIVVTAGFLLLAAAWYLWRSAEDQPSTRHFALRVFAATLLMVGGVLLIIEIPTIVASGDDDLWNGLKVTAYFSLGTVPIQLTIALFLSVLLFYNQRGSAAFRMIYFIPYITPALASATVFRLLFSERQQAPINRFLIWLGVGPQDWLRESDGILTMLANTFGLEGYPQAILPSWLPNDLSALLANWMTGPSQALTVVIMLSIWTFVGYNVVIYLAGLGNIPREMTEAAEIDGANQWQVFRFVTFPLLSPTTYFLSLIAVMGTFKAFNTIWLLRGSVGSGLGTLNTISVVIFEEFFVKTRYGYASAMAFVLFAIILGLTLFNNRIQGSRVFYG
ncbi:MAG TPA: ABC transporter permease subunit [Anaerolineales bacterium]|jgi:multiple sugar transport system permease protein